MRGSQKRVMNNLSSTVFGKLFYLRNGLFFKHGLSHAIKNGVYKETFSVGSAGRSTLDFNYNHKMVEGHRHFCFKSTIVLDGKYRELYLFNASSYGVHEIHNLCYLVDGWVEREMSLLEIQPLLQVLENSEHLVHYSNLNK